MSLSKIKPELNANDIVEVFNSVFAESHGTTLIGGADEPYYRVADGKATIYFREDFIASALHEVSHWCLAGIERRQQNDYGYWYVADRDAEAQARFEAVEVKPQALEWLFSQLLGIPFRVSADNLALENYDSLPFRRQVQEAAKKMVSQGLQGRALTFALALNAYVRTDQGWCQVKERLNTGEIPN